MGDIVNPLTMELDDNGIDTESCLFEDQRDLDVHPLTDQELDKLLEDRALEVSDEVTAQAVLEYPKYFAHRFIPSPNQHGNGNRRPTHIAIHTIQGSYEGCISWFQQKRSYVSAHYVVSFGGHTTQMVYENYIAWHVGSHNGYTIGIEHEGYAHDGVPPTKNMFHASAKLTAGACLRWGIPINRDRIRGHREYAGQTHTDPGDEWNMNEYVNLVRHYAKKEAARPVKEEPKQKELSKPDTVYFIYHKNAMKHVINSAKAAAAALSKFGIDARAEEGSANANFAARKALNGQLGQHITIVQGALAMTLFDPDLRRKFTNSNNNWYHPDKTDVWDARTSVTKKSRWNVSRIAERSGIDRRKALEEFDYIYDWLQSRGKEDNVPKQKEGGNSVGDTAPRTRFTSRINFGVWHPIARRAAREIYGIFGEHRKHVTLHTYPGHDGDPEGAMADGTSFSVDFYVAPFNRRPSAAQKAVGQQMVNYACRNWNRLGLDKIIWNGYYTRDGRNWYRYKWWKYRYNWGAAKLPDKNHTNHPHMRFGNWR